MKIFCKIGIHTYRIYLTKNIYDPIVYLECKCCKKRKIKDMRSHPWDIPKIDKEWLMKKTNYPKY